MVFLKFVIAFKADGFYMLDYSSGVKSKSVIRKIDQSAVLLTNRFVLFDMESPYIFQECIYTTPIVFHNSSPFPSVSTLYHVAETLDRNPFCS